MNNLLVALAVFLITVLGALFAVPYFIDWNGYRTVFEDEATRFLGREVRVNGSVNLHLLPTPFFRFEKVRIADPSASHGEPFFRAESLTVRLTLAPLLKGAIEANEIELYRPVLRLAVNDRGSWNWQSFAEAIAAASYVPSHVVLQSVKIREGVLSVHAANGVERTRLENLTGELAAPSLEGPYRFRGTFGTGPGEHELRISTTRSEPDGSVRFKASLRALDARWISTLEARASDLMGKPRIEGELMASVPLAGFGLRSAAVPETGREKVAFEADADHKNAPSEAAFELKGALTADAAGMTLSSLALALEQDGRPQFLTGEVRASWRDALNLDMSFSSRWLDFDRIAGTAEGTGPMDSVMVLASYLRRLLPSEGQARAGFSVDQASLGHDTVTGLRLALSSSSRKLEVEDLRANTPGGGRAELRGTVLGSPEAQQFNGELALRGSSLTRFLVWASAGATPLDSRADGPFGVRALLTVGSGHVVARELVGTLAGTSVSGEIAYNWQGRREISIALEGAQVDTRAFLPAGGLVRNLTALLSSAGAKGAGRGDGTLPDARVRLQIGQLITSTHAYRDVAAALELKNGHLKLPYLRLSGDEGFSFEAEGDIKDALSSPKGYLQANVSIDSDGAVAPLAALFEWPDLVRSEEGQGKGLAPIRLAASLWLGERTAGAADVAIEGETNDANVKLAAKLDGGLAGWRNGLADVTAVAHGDGAARIAALFSPGRMLANAKEPSAAPGRIWIKCHGVPATGLTSLAMFEVGDLSVSFRGRLTARRGGLNVEGALDLKANDASRFASMWGLPPLFKLEAQPIAGSARILADENAIRIDGMALRIADSDVKGGMALASVGERRRVEARLDVNGLTLSSLLVPLLDRRFAVASAAEAALSGRVAPWPDAPFDFSGLGQLDGEITVTSDRLTIAEGITLANARLETALDGGSIVINRIEGKGLGGQWRGTARIEKAAAGVVATGTLQLAGGALEMLVPQARVSGPVSGTLSFTGRGLSPRALVASLQGSGVLELSEAKVAGLWPPAIAMAAEAALKAEPEKLGIALKQGLAAGLMSETLPLGLNKAEIEIVDGQLRLKPLSVEVEGGRAAGEARLDLQALTFDTEWRIEAKPAAAAAGDAAKGLPPVTVSLSGPLKSLANLEPRINAEALENELTVRRMERSVEELERLRKLDEGRRRGEAERRGKDQEQPPPGGRSHPPAVEPAPPAGSAPSAASTSSG
jgi:uncharacterized protein involved in outer membrane biogenesis